MSNSCKKIRPISEQSRMKILELAKKIDGKEAFPEKVAAAKKAIRGLKPLSV